MDTIDQVIIGWFNTDFGTNFANGLSWGTSCW
jgi:hypothetical protein